MRGTFPDKVSVTDAMIEKYGLRRMVRLAMKTRAAKIPLEIPWHFCYLLLAKQEAKTEGGFSHE